VASWRPHEEGGSGGAHIRASEKHCDHIFVYGDVILMQYHDGFWETGSVSYCSVTWSDKPEVYVVDEATGREMPVEIKGNVNTIADNLKIVLRKPMSQFVPMTSTDENIAGAYTTNEREKHRLEAVEREKNLVDDQSSVH
jgi:hypothetical protein